MTDELEKEKYTKDFIVREIAARANFTIGDARIMFNAFESIIEDAVESHDEITIGGLFKVYIHEIQPSERYDVHTKKMKPRGTTYRLTIRPSTTLKKILKNSEYSSGGGSSTEEE